MKKKLWITIGILALLSLWAIMYVPYNLEEYNYYYATHMKHKSDQYPFISALGMAKMPPEYLPDYRVEYFSKRDTQDNTLTKQNVLKKGDYLMIYSSYFLYASSKKEFHNGNFSGFPLFSSDGTLLSSGKSKLDKQLIAVLDDTQNELKHNSKKPLINLQTLYDREFNSMNGK